MKHFLLVTAAFLTLSGSALAQDAASPQITAAPAAAIVSDAEISQVAVLANDVKALQAEAAPKVAAAADENAKAAAQKDLDRKIQAAVTKSGLTVERYNEIAHAAAADKALATRIAVAGNTAPQGAAANVAAQVKE